MVPHTRTILRSSAADQDHAVLLDVVALAGDVGRNDSARRELDTGRLSLARVGLLGLDDTDTQADALEGRAVCVGQGGRDGVASALALAAAAEHLVDGGRAGGCCGKWRCCSRQDGRLCEEARGARQHRGRREERAASRRGEQLSYYRADHCEICGCGCPIGWDEDGMGVIRDVVVRSPGWSLQLEN